MAEKGTVVQQVYTHCSECSVFFVGFPSFISLEELKRYIKDDVLFIKVNVYMDEITTV